MKMILYLHSQGDRDRRPWQLRVMKRPGPSTLDDNDARALEETSIERKGERRRERETYGRGEK